MGKISTGKELPKAMGHYGHGSLIDRTSFGSAEARFDGKGSLMDVVLTIENIADRHFFTPDR